MSFFDLPLNRQEEIWVETIGYVNQGRASWWERRRDEYEKLLRETYANMDAADLTAHHHELKEDHPDDERWAPVIDAVTDELKTRANRGDTQ